MDTLNYSISAEARQIQEEISRIRKAQAMMESVNDAIGRRDLAALHGYPLSPDHIAALLRRHRQGLAPYPAFLFRHNQEYLDLLEAQLKQHEAPSRAMLCDASAAGSLA